MPGGTVKTTRESEEAAGQGRGAKPRRLIAGVRLRVALLILVMQFLLIWWVADSEIARGIYLICYTLMMPTALYLLLTRVLRRWLPFEDNELLLGYIVLTATLPIIGFGGLRFLVFGMGYMPFFSQMQPDWLKYVPFLNSLPVLHDPEAIRFLYRGGSGVPWHAWMVPIAFWSVYLLLLSAIWLCLAGILRRVWIHQERLTFPVAVLPLQLMDKRENVFRRPLLWMGFAIPAVMQSLLVINQWAPSVPAVQLKAHYVTFINPPWNAVSGLAIGFYPMAIGLAYFIPSSVSLSCWLLAVLMKFVYVAGAVMGVEPAGYGASGFPYKEEQAAGSWIALAGLVIWGARYHWRTVAKSVASDERGTVRGLTIIAGACMFACALMMMVTGMPAFAAAGIIIVYVAYVLTGARVRAEAGGQWTFSPLFWTPHRVTYSILGTQGMSDGVLAAGGYFSLIHVDMRAQSLPYLMEGLSIAEKSGIRWRTVLVWVGIGTVTALAIGWWASLSKVYALGAAAAKVDRYALIKTQRAFDEVQRVSLSSRTWDQAGVLAMVGAGALTVLLSWTHRSGILPIHPIGYVLCNTLIMSAFIVPFFIAWLAKTLVLRFGGSRTYRHSVPFFVGIILGDVVIQAAWALVGWLFNLPIYQFLS